MSTKELYLVTMKTNAYEERPLELNKDLFMAKHRKYDYKIAWGDSNPIKIYKATLEEIVE